MSADADLQTKLHRIVEDLIQRAMSYGPARGQATRLGLGLCLKEPDRRARERRSRFRVIK
jgi:hypothetical protein